jgi:hypothetical protein
LTPPKATRQINVTNTGSYLREAGDVGCPVEWEGGTFGNAPSGPKMALWLSAGMVVRSLVQGEGTPEQLLLHAFHMARESPVHGKPGLPFRVRVADRAMMESLSKQLQPLGVEVLCMPTPEIDQVVLAMQEELSIPASDGLQTRKSSIFADASVEEVHAFFQQALELFDEKPWRTWSVNPPLMKVTCPELAMNKSALRVLDPWEPFPTLELSVRGRAETKGPKEVASSNLSTLSLLFVPNEDVPDGMRELLASEGWVVGEHAVLPWLVCTQLEGEDGLTKVDAQRMFAVFSGWLASYRQDRSRVQERDVPLLVNCLGKICHVQLAWEREKK